MKQAVYYLYEYEENEQMRNVGFVKCQHKDQQAIFQIHGKGLVCKQGEKYEMNLFSGERDRCYISRAGHVETQLSKINYMVTVNEVEETIFQDYDGLYIHGHGNIRYVAMWNTKEVTFDQVQSYKKVEELEPEYKLDTEDVMEGVEEIQEQSSEHSELVFVESEEVPPVIEEVEYDCPIEAEECCYDAIRRRKEPETVEYQNTKTYEKIERQDIAKLPQREWRLANNSFLLHGYHNYQHILFIQEAGRSFIGVPGIFSPREADAAKSFGFPVFHRIEPGLMLWEDEECDREADFGYWCKEVSYRMNR